MSIKSLQHVLWSRICSLILTNPFCRPDETFLIVRRIWRISVQDFESTSSPNKANFPYHVTKSNSRGIQYTDAFKAVSRSAASCLLASDWEEEVREMTVWLTKLAKIGHCHVFISLALFQPLGIGVIFLVCLSTLNEIRAKPSALLLCAQQHHNAELLKVFLH